MRYVVGLDGGGTKTLAVLMREDGAISRRGRGGPANLNFVSMDVVRDSVRAALEQALAGLPAGQTLAAIGGHVLAPQEAFADILEELSPHASYHAFGEAAIASVGVVGIGQPGVVVIAGTGSQATGFGADGRQKSAGGWGTPLGDEGGAGQIGWQALQAATRAYDGRMPPTELLGAVYEHFQVPDLWILVRNLYAGKVPRHEIAALAPLVVRYANHGDQAARSILKRAGEELALLAATAARHVGLSRMRFPVVTAGAVFRAGVVIIKPLETALREFEPYAYLCPPRFESEVGAALLTLAACGVSLDEALLMEVERRARLAQPFIST